MLVHIRPFPSAPPAPASFAQSVVNTLSGAQDKDEVSVECELEEGNRMVLARCERPVGRCGGALLRRPPRCPINLLKEEDIAKIPAEISARGVAVGVVALAESSDARVLVTRRARHMRTFPGVWVPPGGSADPGEALLDAGLRELKEETGLGVDPGESAAARLLCLWESVYPPFLERGPPRRHHVVVYYHIPLGRGHSDLDAELRLQPEEVDASAWLSEEDAEAVVRGAASGNNNEFPEKEEERIIRVRVLEEDGKTTRDVERPLRNIAAAKAPTEGVDVERFSSGTIFALSQWLEMKQKSIKAD